MERFAIKIDKKLRANLYKICRLCGIDNPEMVPILSNDDAEAANKNINEAMDVEAEPEMPQKIKLLIGLVITKDDKMPQTMCSLCVDKINDFYEFREMCYATNAQTRKLLGLKSVKTPVPDIKPKLEIKEEQVIPKVNTTKAKVVIKDSRKRKQDETEEFIGRESRKRKQEESTPVPLALPKKENVLPVVSNKKLRLASMPLKEAAAKKAKQKYREDSKDLEIKEEIKEEPKEERNLQSAASISVVPNSTTLSQVNNKLKHICTICSERFGTKIKLDSHTRLHHVPKIERFVCTACNETISKGFDIKNHQLWHKLSKTPYVCGLCGESILSSYAYTRHIREHSFETPPALLVLDRECPQCHVTYATNFLYNTHSCAIKAKRCAGCNRLQRSDAEFIKHSALCAKVYLNYSKHIMPTVEAQEDEVRIKNENDVEAAAEEMARITGMPLDMAPVVQLTRLSSPLIMAATQCVSIPSIEESPSTSSKKTGKKGMSKKDLRRVDELLKSTLDALVSIKHEPEVHVETEPPPAECGQSDNEGTTSDNSPNMDVGFQEEDDSENSASETHPEQIVIKKEIVEPHETPTSGGGLKLKIRKEHGQLNSSLIEQQKTDDKRAEKRKKKKKHKDKVKDKLKLHRELQEEQNSLDSFNTQHNEDNISSAESPVGVRIKTEPVDETVNDAPGNSQARLQPEAMIMTSIPMMQLQISCISEGVEFNSSTAHTVAAKGDHDQQNQELTTEVSDTPISATPSTKTTDNDDDDVKPNRKELDRLMKISHISSGIEVDNQAVDAIAHDVDPQNHNDEVTEDNGDDDVERNAVEANVEDPFVEASRSVTELPITGIHYEYREQINKTSPVKQKTPPFKNTATKSRNKACKSTAKPSFATPASTPILQISSVISGVSLPLPSESPQNEFSPVFIKPEPLHRGYSDEYPSLSSSAQNDSDDNVVVTQQHPSLATANEEQAYISSIDFNNITIKQEKDLEINDVQVGENIPRYCDYSFNGIKKHKDVDRVSRKATNSMDGNDEMEMNDVEEEEEFDEDHSDEGEEDDVEEEGELEEEEEEREYRELEYPPEMKTNEEKDILKTTCNFENQNENLSRKSNNNNIEEIAKTSAENDTTTEQEHSSLEKGNQLSSISDFVISNVYSHALKSSDLGEVSKENSLFSSTDNKSVIEEIPVLKIASIASGFNIASISQFSDENPNKFCAENMDAREYEIGELKTEVRNQTIEGAEGISKLFSDNPLENVFEGVRDNVSTSKNLNSDHIRMSCETSDVERFNRKQQTEKETESNSEALTKPSNELEAALINLPDSIGNLSGESEKDLETNFITDAHHEVLKQYPLKSTEILESSERSGAIKIDFDQKVSSENINILPMNANPTTSNSNEFNNDAVIPNTYLGGCTRSETIEGLVIVPGNDVPLMAKPCDASVHVENEIEMNEEEENEDDNENSVDDEEENESKTIEETNYNIHSLSTLNLEEQQNQQNQQQLQENQIDLGQPTALALHPYLEDISSSSNSFLSNTLSQTPPPTQQPTIRHSAAPLNHSEETENILNESAVVGRSRHPSLDFDNINEIAENNNNANLEREQLQDDQQYRNNVV